MIEVLDMRLIDKISAATTKDQLLDSSLAMARSEKVRETPVASRKLSSLPLRLLLKLSVLAAVKAAFCSVEDGTIKKSTVLFL